MNRDLCPAGVFLFLGLLAGVTGCHSVGPHSIPRDRSDYSSAISESWKRQTLLNIVKLRYSDPPVFVDVGQIVSGYQLQMAANLGGQISSAGAIQGNSMNLGGAGTFIDRPTITYVPLTGNKFIKGLMMPLSPESLFFTIQAGYSADAVLSAGAAEINGLKNQATSISGTTAPDPEFGRVVTLMRQIQQSGAVAFRVKQDAQKQQTSILTFRSKDVSPQTLEDIRELRRLLRLDPEATELRLVYGAVATSDRELAVLPRSLVQMMAMMSAQASVPEQDVKEGRAPPGWESTAQNTNAVRFIRIESSRSRPGDAFVSVNYRDHWFWIDDRDLKSKRAFSFMMMLFTLAETGEKESLPLITIPAQ